MTTALFAFDGSDTARRAAAELQRGGLSPESVRLQLHARASESSTVAAVDEQVSGGLLSNLYGLFGEMLEWGSVPIETSPYAAALRRGGAVVSVDADSDAQRAQVEAVMAEAHPTAASEWFEFPHRAGTPA